MSSQNKEAWDKWHIERHLFATRDTEGFNKDLEALKAHITKLQKVCPKDPAGWPVPAALSYLNKLQADCSKFTQYLKNLKILQ